MIIPDLDLQTLQEGSLTPKQADFMIENCIGILPLPLGVGLGFNINKKNYIIPMALEEPSVIAACSALGKIISEKGSGFQCTASPPLMIAQIQVSEIFDFARAEKAILQSKGEIIEYGNQFCESMVSRGGGVVEVRVRQIEEDMAVVELLVNVCEVMGANIVNTIAEGTAPFIQETLQQGKIGMRILSNLCTERISTAEFSIPVKEMGWKGLEGLAVCEKILSGQRFAEKDQFRATTHNKGIMNGVDAVALALGQDWRAIESAAHSYASIGGKYLPLTKYWIEGELFKGKLTLPLAVGAKGGSIETNPAYINTHKILGFPSADEISFIMVSVGLAQNLAALRALSVEGIQKGHMNLHARNVAVKAGVSQDRVGDAVEFMKVRNRINTKTAQQYMRGRDLFISNQQQSEDQKHRKLSTFYVEIKEKFLPEPLILTVLLDCKLEDQSVHLAIEKDHGRASEQERVLSNCLFGGNKGYEWLKSFLRLLDSVSFKGPAHQKVDTVIIQYRLKLLVVLVNLIITHLLDFQRDATIMFVKRLIEYLNSQKQQKESSYQNIKQSILSATHSEDARNLVIPYGFSLLLEMVFNFTVYCREHISSPLLKKQVVGELKGILESLVLSTEQFLLDQSSLQKGQKISQPMLEKYMQLKRKKMNLQMMQLIDLVGANGSVDEQLLDFFAKFSKVLELRAVAFKDLQNPNKINNLYNYWHMHMLGKEDANLDCLQMKMKFFLFIEEHCRKLIQESQLRESPYFNEKLFNQTMGLIESYYKLDSRLVLLAKETSHQKL